MLKTTYSALTNWAFHGTHWMHPPTSPVPPSLLTQTYLPSILPDMTSHHQKPVDTEFNLSVHDAVYYLSVTYSGYGARSHIVSFQRQERCLPISHHPERKDVPLYVQLCHQRTLSSSTGFSLQRYLHGCQPLFTTVLLSEL